MIFLLVLSGSSGSESGFDKVVSELLKNATTKSLGLLLITGEVEAGASVVVAAGVVGAGEGAGLAVAVEVDVGVGAGAGAGAGADEVVGGGATAVPLTE